MNRRIRHLTSFNNFRSDKLESGQIATVMILFMIVLLVFVLVTVNIGNVSFQGTLISQAADAGALALGSGLATKARAIADALRDECGSATRCCKKTGAAAGVFAFIAALIVAIASCISGCVAMPLLIAVCMAAGAAGGAIGASYAGTDMAQGVAMGAIIGACVGMAAGGIGGAMISGGSEAMMGGVVVMETAPIVAGAGTAMLGVMGTAASLYNAYNADQMYIDAFAEVSKKLNALNERDRYREGAFMAALSVVVDDPNKVKDDRDLDDDGNTAELASAFLNFWDNRIDNIRAQTAVMTPVVVQFIEGPLRNFRDFVNGAITGTDTTFTLWPSGTYTHHTPGLLERRDYIYDASDTPIAGTTDGPIATFLRGVYPTWTFNYADPDTGTVSPVFVPGPTPAEITAWYDDPCGDVSETEICPPPPAGFDYVDSLYEDFRQWLAFGNGILEDIDYSAIAWDNWKDILYNPEDPSDVTTFYGALDRYITMMTDIQTQFPAVVNSYPPCLDGYFPAGTESWSPTGMEWQNQPAGLSCGNCGDPCPWDCTCDCYRNPPCRIIWWAGDGFSVDRDKFDELWGGGMTPGAVTGFMELSNNLQQFRNDILMWYGWIESMRTTPEILAWGGYPNCEYHWTDTRGEHAIQVAAGAFRIARIKVSKHGNWLKGKVCQNLRDYQDEDRAWIRVTRQDGNRQALGGWGLWNPFNRPLSRRSFAEYSYDFVRLKNR